MGEQSLLQLIGLKNNADLSAAGTRFIENIRQYINVVENNPSEKNIEKENTEITVLYRSFFPYSIEWAEKERQKYQSTQNHPEAGKLKDKGSAAIKDLQDNIIDFSLCYMKIHRSMGLINTEMKRLPESDEEEASWKGDLAAVLAKYRKERDDLIASNAKLSQCYQILTDINSQRSEVEKCATELFGEELAHKTLSTYRSNLRVGDFAKARKGLKNVEKQKKKFSFDKKKTAQKEETIKKSGEAYIACLEQHHEILTGGGNKLYLKPSEVSIIRDANDKELERKEEFIRKYFRPFLNHQIKKLKYLRTKLLVVGSLESLMTLYIALMRGIAEPLTEIKAVRIYESEVIEHVSYLLDGQFQEMKNIEERVEEILQEFHVSVHDYKEVN